MATPKRTSGSFMRARYRAAVGNARLPSRTNVAPARSSFARRALAHRLHRGRAMVELGETVGNYRVVAKLGEGGMGAVYLAEHPIIGRKAALKVINPQHARN